MWTIGLTHYLILAAMLFCIGVAAIVTKRNAIGILIGVELILNAGNLNFVAFSRYQGADIAGQVVAMFGIVLAAAEAAIAVAIVVNLYNATATIDVDSATTLRG